MTVLTTTSRIAYVGDNAEDTFTYDFKLLSSDDLEVYLDSVLQSTGYTVNGVGDAGGGTVVFDTAPGTDVDIILSRNVEYTQPTDYTEYDKFPAETHEAALDRLAMQIQQLYTLIGLSVSQSVGSEIDGLTLPAPSSLGILRWNTDADDLEAVSITALESAVSSVTQVEAEAGTETADRLWSPERVNQAIQALQTKISVVASLPGSPDSTTLYFVTT